MAHRCEPLNDDDIIKGDIMKDFLSEKVKEVYDMVNIEWNMDTAKEVWLEEGKAEGKAEGRQEEKHSIALNLKKLGVSIEQIAFATGLSIEEIEKL